MDLKTKGKMIETLQILETTLYHKNNLSTIGKRLISVKTNILNGTKLCTASKKAPGQMVLNQGNKEVSSTQNAQQLTVSSIFAMIQGECGADLILNDEELEAVEIPEPTVTEDAVQGGDSGREARDHFAFLIWRLMYWEDEGDASQAQNTANDDVDKLLAIQREHDYRRSKDLSDKLPNTRYDHEKQGSRYERDIENETHHAVGPKEHIAVSLTISPAHLGGFLGSILGVVVTSTPKKKRNADAATSPGQSPPNAQQRTKTTSPTIDSGIMYNVSTVILLIDGDKIN
ncbi:hypothetical protein C8J56DRAFT_902041 [Mycena floridula]|nr:hypothetical protein C8J56DRAFT_902041 [Mycena floridula]